MKTLPGDGRDERCTKPFLGHLEDLRRSLVWSLCSFGVGMAVALPLAPAVLSWLMEPARRAGLDPGIFLRVITGTGGFVLTMRIVFWTGLLISLPLMAVATALFVFPGLKTRERRVVWRGAIFAVFLFAGGVAVCYYGILPVAIRWMVGINEWIGVTCEFWEINDYIGFTLKLLVACGLAFELPVVVLALGWLGIVSSRGLRKFRRYAIVGLMALAAVITPTPDPLTMTLFAVPLVGLYEFCVWTLHFRERKKSAEDARSGQC